MNKKLLAGIMATFMAVGFATASYTGFSVMDFVTEDSEVTEPFHAEQVSDFNEDDVEIFPNEVWSGEEGVNPYYSFENQYPEDRELEGRENYEVVLDVEVVSGAESVKDVGIWIEDLERNDETISVGVWDDGFEYDGSDNDFEFTEVVQNDEENEVAVAFETLAGEEFDYRIDFETDDEISEEDISFSVDVQRR